MNKSLTLSFFPPWYKEKHETMHSGQTGFLWPSRPVKILVTILHSCSFLDWLFVSFVCLFVVWQSSMALKKIHRCPLLRCLQGEIPPFYQLPYDWIFCWQEIARPIVGCVFGCNSYSLVRLGAYSRLVRLLHYVTCTLLSYCTFSV